MNAMNRPRRTIPGPALLALLIAFLSCDNEPGPSDLDPATAFIRGTVTMQKTGLGVPNLIVALVEGDDVVAAAATDRDGRFGFERRSAGEYVARLLGLELTPLAPGTAALEPPSLVVHVGADPVELVFTVVGLIPPRVNGTVSCHGTPVAGARVRVVGGTTDLSVDTNALGRYAANDLDTGLHTILLESAPCTASPAWEVVDLQPGQAREVNLGS
jgi:hypothetical protein